MVLTKQIKQEDLNQSFVDGKITIIYKLYEKPDKSFASYECINDDGEKILISGSFKVPITIGFTYIVAGKPFSYNNERQIRVTSVKTIRPETKSEIIHFIDSLPGLCAYGNDVYNEFGENSIDTILFRPEEIKNIVPNIESSEIYEWGNILFAIKNQNDIFDILRKYGVPEKYIFSFFTKYKDQSVNVIVDNPYVLMDDEFGLTFKQCDKIAQLVKIKNDSDTRVLAAIRYVLKRASIAGDCYVETSNMADFVATLIGGKKKEYMKNRAKEIISECNSLDMQDIIIQNERIYFKELFDAQNVIADRIYTIAKNEEIAFDSVEKYLNQFLETYQYTLEDKQKRAVLDFSRSKGGFFVLNGAAGCGKTFVLNIILSILKTEYKANSEDCVISVFAPTGKAAKVAAKSTNMMCETIHRGLGFNPETGFYFNETRKLSSDCIVIDESSMLDIQLAKHLLSAIQDNAKVIFLGDTHQLPSIGAGNVLHDIIVSQCVHVVTLDVVKRQGEKSGIVKNANAIINGQIPTSQKEVGDALVIKKDSPVKIHSSIVRWINKLRNESNLSIDEIQVLSAQRTGAIGVDALNYTIQCAVNGDCPPEATVPYRKIESIDLETGCAKVVQMYLKKGDKVIHTRNNYNMVWYQRGQYWDYSKIIGMTGITNGEIGIIEDIAIGTKADTYNKRIIVRYDDGFVYYDDYFEELEPAYALTIHKSQGSQWGVIIVPINESQTNMLSNNLLYTAWTRAKKMAILLGDENAIRYAVCGNNLKERKTGLDDILKQKFARKV